MKERIAAAAGARMTKALTARLAVAEQQWKLSTRQREVLRRIVMGDSNKEIMAELGLREGTVETHVTALLRKANVDTRARLVASFWMVLEANAAE
jgi:DNA-binding NarL/FixJ family response regulator